MSYEVEMKFPVSDFDAVTGVLEEAGAQQQTRIEQTDRYFSHPCRDFAETDEALRIRSTDSQTRLTYKGPLIDRETKSRREIELPLGDGSGAAMAEALMALGFEPVATVTKHRIAWSLGFQNRAFEVVCDDVNGLGRFVEIETTADDDELDAARAALRELAERLQLKDSTRRSYLQMLLEADASSTP